MSDHMPLTVESPTCVPQPSFEVSVNICRAGLADATVEPEVCFSFF